MVYKWTYIIVVANAGVVMKIDMNFPARFFLSLVILE